MSDDPLEAVRELYEALEREVLHIACCPAAADTIRAEAIRRGLLVEVHPSRYVPAGTAYAWHVR